MRRLLLPGFLAITLLGCSEAPEEIARREWLEVLEQKRTATASEDATARQAYADAVASFVRQHPGHDRGLSVYDDLQFEFARQLERDGRYEEAEEHYAAIARRQPSRSEVAEALERVRDRQVVTAEEVLALSHGMSREEVREMLGEPLPGGLKEFARGNKSSESWYYRRDDGGTAAVYFTDGKVVGAEYDAETRLAPR
jgi:hypothetical protein